MRPMSLTAGQGWRFEHDDYTYMILCVDGSGVVTLSYRLNRENASWELGQSRNLHGHQPSTLARELYRETTSWDRRFYARVCSPDGWGLWDTLTKQWAPGWLDVDEHTALIVENALNRDYDC